MGALLDEVNIEVYLGRMRFSLRGLPYKSRERVLQAWGPFVTLSKVSRAANSAGVPDELTPPQMAEVISEAEVKIQFYLTERPQEQTFDYQRGDDVALMTRSSSGRVTSAVESWIDGSLGSIEATLQITLQWVLCARGGLLIHASAGVYRGMGWLIPGVSGAGKSTAAREGGFDQILSDEMVIVVPDSSQDPYRYRLFSTPFWSEGRSAPLIIADAPLSLIAFPHKAGSAKLSPCSTADSVAKLLRAVTCYEQTTLSPPSTTQRASLFEHTCRVVESTPHYVLAFPKYGPWLHTLPERESGSP